MKGAYRVVRGTWQGVAWECFERSRASVREASGRERAEAAVTPLVLRARREPEPAAV